MVGMFRTRLQAALIAHPGGGVAMVVVVNLYK